jgi:hypothetical protein
MQTRRLMTIVISLLGTSIGGAAASPEAAAVHPVPAAKEPRHHVVFQNELATVMDVQVPPGDTTLYHVHAHPLIGVSLRNARTWDQLLGSPASATKDPDPVPRPLDNWDRPRPYTHRVGNVDSVPFHYVVAEWLKSSGVACEPLPDTPARRLVKQGPTAIVYELQIPPHSAIPRHAHSCPGLIVQGTEGSLEDDGPASAAAGGAGEGRWSWHAPGHEHALKNTGEAAMVVYEIEWR